MTTGRRSRSAAAGSPRNSPPTGSATPDMLSRPAASWSRRIRRLPMLTTSSTPAAASDESRPRRAASSAPIGPPPPLQERPRLAVDGIVSWQCHLRNVAPRPFALLCGGPTYFRALPAGIGSDNHQIRARPLALVGNASWDHNDITGAQLNRLAALAAEPDPNGSSGDAERLVRGAVIVMMRVDPVDPGCAPVITGKQRLASSRGTGTGFKHGAIDDQRQIRIIRHMPVVGEEVLFDGYSVWCFGHSAAPSRRLQRRADAQLSGYACVWPVGFAGCLTAPSFTTSCLPQVSGSSADTASLFR